MTEYQIQPLSFRCAQTGRELKPGEQCYSALIESPDGLRRIDYAAEAWPGPPPGAIAFWRSRVPRSAPGKGPQPLDDAVLVQFFERLADAEQESSRNFRYILTLLLLRKKILKLTDTVTDGDREILIVRKTATGDEYRVLNPGLTGTQLMALEADVEKILRSPIE
jgi:hypothetical protein